MADLHLGPDPSLTQVAGTDQLASAVEAATGPGVVVIAGNLFDSQIEPAPALADHSRLVHALAAYAARPGRRVIVLPGDRDARLASSAECRCSVATTLGAELALAVELLIDTGAGLRPVRVEPGHRLDALSRFEDPRNSRETPFAQHIREELLPSVRRRQKGVTGAGTGWLAGMEQLDDPAAFSRFIASRLVYRRLGRSWWLLLAPVIAILALRLPSLALRSARSGALFTRLGILVLFTLAELVLLMVLAGAAVRRTTRALSALALDEGRRDPNDTARAEARRLITAGHAGLITAHTCRPELAYQGDGFYANVGSGSEVVTEVPTRLPGLGLPPAFLAYRQTSWVELEAGSDLHARLLHARQDLPGATLARTGAGQRGGGIAAGRAAAGGGGHLPAGPGLAPRSRARPAPSAGAADGRAGRSAGRVPLTPVRPGRAAQGPPPFRQPAVPGGGSRNSRGSGRPGRGRFDRAGPRDPPGPATGLAGLHRHPDRSRRAAPGQRGRRGGGHRGAGRGDLPVAAPGVIPRQDRRGPPRMGAPGRGRRRRVDRTGGDPGGRARHLDRRHPPSHRRPPPAMAPGATGGVGTYGRNHPRRSHPPARRVLLAGHGDGGRRVGAGARGGALSPGGAASPADSRVAQSRGDPGAGACGRGRRSRSATGGQLAAFQP